MHLTRIVPSALLLPLACTPTAPPPADPNQAPTTTQGMSAPEPDPGPDPDPDPGTHYLLGVSTQTGTLICPTPTQREWVDVRPMLGWVPVSGTGTETLEPLLGRAVLAEGAPGPAPAYVPETPPAGGDCMDMQMRDDWVETPQGIRVQRGPSPAIEHFVMTSARPLTELSAVLEGETIRSRFQNPLPFELEQVQLRLHYEGCGGKPGSTSQTSPTLSLGPGETLEHVFPKRDTGEDMPAVLRLEVGGPESVHVDLDLQIWELGIDVNCDEFRKQKRKLKPKPKLKLKQEQGP